MTTPAQLRAARALVGILQSQISQRTGLSLPTIKRAEADDGIRVSDQARGAIRVSLEKSGVIFVEENGDGPGVRLKKRKRG